LEPQTEAREGDVDEDLDGIDFDLGLENIAEGYGIDDLLDSIKAL